MGAENKKGFFSMGKTKAESEKMDKRFLKECIEKEVLWPYSEDGG